MRLPVCAPSSLGRVLGLAAVVLLALALPAAAQDPASRVPAYDAGLFEIRVARLAAQTVVVQVDPTGRVLLPVNAVLALTAMPVERLHADSVVVVPLVTRTGRDAGKAILDMRAATFQVGDSTIALPAGAAAYVDGEPYLHSEWLARLLNADVEVDFAALTATLIRVPPFPVEQQALAEQRRSAAGGRSRSLERRAQDAPYRQRTGGVVLDWNVSTAPDQPANTTAAQGMLGVAVLGGSLTAGGNWAASSETDLMAGTLNYTFNQPRSRWMRQLQVGDLLGGGVQLRTVRGASITNARYIREGLFSEVPVEPDVPSGWSYEVYQDGQLLGFSESGASQGVLIPLRYGMTPVRVRMLGPAGEEVLSDFRYQIPSTQLAPGTFEYTAGAGQCRDFACELTGFARADWGATSRLTLGASAEWADADTSGVSGNGIRSGVRAMVIPAHDWYATLDVVPSGRSQLLVTHDDFDGMNSAASVGWLEPGGSVVSSVVGTEPRWFGDLRHGRPVSRDGGAIRSARFELHGEGFRGQGIDRLFGSITLDGRRGSYGIRYEQDPSLTGRLVQLSHFTVIRRDAKGRFSYLPLSGSVAFARGGLQRLEGIATVRTGGRGSINLAARWSEGSGTMLSLSYDALLGRARVSARGMSFADGRSTLLTSAGGAAAWSPDAGPIFVDQAGSNLAGLAGRVFYDEDGDGRFGPGDLPATGLGVMAGNQRVKSDAEGRYRVWRILPYEVTTVAVDTLRDIASDFVPLRAEGVLRATPNMYNTVDFPLVRTRELTGRLVGDSGIVSVGGVTVELRNTTTGDTLRTMTFADGEFYISRVRPGTWELRIAASSIAALRAEEPGPMRVTVPGAGTDVLVEIPALRIRRDAPRAPPATGTPSAAAATPGSAAATRSDH